MAKVEVKWIDGMRFVAIPESGHAVIMDSSEDKGGLDSGPRPMELLLISLAGCTGMDVIYILKKMRVQVQGFELKIDAERKQEHPRYYSKVHVKYVFYGKDIPEDKVKQAIELSQHKYCSVSATMRAVGELTYSFEIKEA
ncbi:MAG TPA: OsmC family peroxiredoxin [candidate division WOR-3 bacterium]|uniref:OsmC family peroxiredoxin n=1 Tax=candidate division WOR-3 bacterium TaxID=2052148 RepID=A0A7C5I551_UNCW3|nr:OsmC family protein [Candidatus Hydrothermae bacterium]RKY98211.1 MAG: osmotically inducible protein OsmC [Candidatus Hydrothermae bacterium]HHF58568.1 OsmC family peroxiredoxin [candidate division WOR-3 bacterium]